MSFSFVRTVRDRKGIEEFRDRSRGFNQKFVAIFSPSTVKFHKKHVIIEFHVKRFA
jgi:hypothetical protein